jgi:hypothetical protein
MIKFLRKYTECCEYSELYKDGVQVMSGDYYHDKIDDAIRGYLQAHKDLGIEYEYSSERFENCPNYCDETCDEYQEDDDWDNDEDGDVI